MISSQNFEDTGGHLGAPGPYGVSRDFYLHEVKFGFTRVYACLYWGSLPSILVQWFRFIMFRTESLVAAILELQIRDDSWFSVASFLPSDEQSS